MRKKKIPKKTTLVFKNPGSIEFRKKPPESFRKEKIILQTLQVRGIGDPWKCHKC
jgi:hypothetical protein